ncbi:MAG: glycine--tRNA ligase [Nanobdellota archaeon]
MVEIEEITTFCKEKGYVYQTAEIYGGLAGFFDLGHNGVELKNNIKQEWWKKFVKQRDDIYGIDGSIITHPKVWKASGHIDNFMDLMLTCSKCKEKIRADHFIEEKLETPADGMKAEEINELTKKNNLKCPSCGGEFQETNDFNLMFKTNVGPKISKENTAYLRPETAQLIFANFKLVTEHTRAKLPLGIAQIGKAFRNEISPRDFIFRAREFEQMEIEYFINPKELNECPWVEESYDFEFNVLTADMQEKKIEETKKITGKKALEENIIKTPWHVYWLYHALKYYIDLGANPDNFRIRQHLDNEKSHYALDTWDVDYNFPFGWKELTGTANRTDYDLNQHIKHSKKDLSIFDEKYKAKTIPYVVAEPSFGVERSFLVFIVEAYKNDKERGNKVLKLHPKLAPQKVGVFPLVNKLNQEAREIYKNLVLDIETKFDKAGSIGRRYARADEEGIPFCVTFDFDSREDKCVTIRDRDTTQQKRVKISELKGIIDSLIKEEIKFEDIN